MVCYPIRRAELEDSDVTQHQAKSLTTPTILKVSCLGGVLRSVIVRCGRLRHISYEVCGASTLLHKSSFIVSRKYCGAKLILAANLESRPVIIGMVPPFVHSERVRSRWRLKT